jgi:three-Cys-motif partner protein
MSRSEEAGSGMRPRETTWKLERHSEAKHYTLRRYLQAWLPIMCSAQAGGHERLVLIDGFAGPGIYVEGQPGSPIIMLEAFLEHAQRQRITAELVYFFIEQDEARAARLADEIDKLGELPDQVRLEIKNDTFETAFSEVLAGVEAEGRELAPTFAFVDPFGYTGAPMSLTGRFLNFQQCEVMIYVPLSFVGRFVGREGQEDALTSLFGTTRWQEAIPMGWRRRRKFLHDLFRDQLKADCGLRFVRSFEILTNKPKSGYHLFFGTNSTVGLERMKSVMWAVDRVEGRRFKNATMPDQQVLFEPDEPDVTVLEQALREHFGTRVFTIDEAESFTLVQTPYLSKHLKKPILKRLELDGELDIVTAIVGRRKGTYADGRMTVRFSG